MCMYVQVVRYQDEYKELAKLVNSGVRPKSEPRFPAFEKKELPECWSKAD